MKENFSKMLGINKAKWLPRTFVIIILFFIIFISNDIFNNYSDKIIALTTVTYAYLTYEILRTAQQGKTIPYIDVSFIMTSRLDKNFLDNYPGLIKNERVETLIKHFEQESPAPKNLVFLQAENIGETNAIDIGIDLKWKKKNIKETKENDKTLNFNTLKANDKSILLIDVYDSPSKED